MSEYPFLSFYELQQIMICLNLSIYDSRWVMMMLISRCNVLLLFSLSVLILPFPALYAVAVGDEQAIPQYLRPPPTFPMVIRNQSTGLTTYTNEAYGITFDFPADWPISTSMNLVMDQLIHIRPPDEEANRIPESSKTGTGFSVAASGVSTYLDPNTLQVKTLTARDYATLEKDTNAKIASQFDRYVSFTYDYVKDYPIIVSNETNAWRVDAIMNENDVQIEFLSDVFVIKNNILYRFHFYTQPLNVPNMLPIAEKIVQSFRFI